MRIIAANKTRIGNFYIGQSSDGRFHPVYDGDSLGSYSEAWMAVDDLNCNATVSVLHPKTHDLVDTSQSPGGQLDHFAQRECNDQSYQAVETRGIRDCAGTTGRIGTLPHESY